jgi:hypothetical protein
MPIVETRKGYSIYSAIAATISSLAAVSPAYRVTCPNGSKLAGGPFKTISEARDAIDAHIGFDKRYALDTKSDAEKYVVDTTCEPRRKVGSIKFNGPGKHSAFDADGNNLGEFRGGKEAKEAIIESDPLRK